MIRVLLVDDHPAFREPLRRYLEITQPDIEVAGEVGDGGAVLDVVGTTNPDVVLLDIGLPNTDGVSVTRELKARWPDLSVVILTAYKEPEVALRAVKAGACSYVGKWASPEEIVRAIRAAVAGGSVVDPQVNASLLEELKRGSDPAALTAVEEEILQLVVKGLTNREIAERLNFAEPTVKNRLTIIFHKIGIARRSQAAEYLNKRRRGLTLIKD